VEQAVWGMEPFVWISHQIELSTFALLAITSQAGTRGDVQPAIALALRLMQDGHHIRLATHEMYASLVKEVR